MRTYSAWVPSIVLPRIQPPVVQWEYMPRRQYSHLPQDEMQEIEDPVARLEGGDAGADLLDDADAFVAQDAPGRAGRDIALQDMQVGAADRGLGDPDDRVRRSGDLRHRPVFERLGPGPL